MKGVMFYDNITSERSNIDKAGGKNQLKEIIPSNYIGGAIMKNNITLQALSAENHNWYDCCKLELTEEQQGFMESNAISIAHSKFEKTLEPYAICLDNDVIGFLMYNTDTEELDAYWIYRIMLDKAYQNQGIGKIAAELMISKITELSNAKRIAVGYHPENKASGALWKSLGFVDNGDRFGREIVVVKEL